MSEEDNKSVETEERIPSTTPSLEDIPTPEDTPSPLPDTPLPGEGELNEKSLPDFEHTPPPPPPPAETDDGGESTSTPPAEEE